MMGRILTMTAAALLLFAIVPFPAPPSGEGAPPTASAPSLPSAAYDTLRTAFHDYIWPTDGGRKMTSSFAEFRRTHFHGGVDIGTGSTTGYHVFAMRDGYVSRIRVSPTGYGKMLFVRHPDGFMTTYAHLSSFNPALNARVAREQARMECFAVDLQCGPGEFPVQQGDLIAYTGESGVGTPHLHFELRDPRGDFVNPLLCDSLKVHDTTPPRVRRIAVRPIGPDSRVDGEWRPRVYGVRRGRGGALTIEGTIHLTGRAGIAVDARDITNGSGFRHGVYGYDLFLDDTLIHRHRLDRAPANASQQIMMYYDWDLLAQGKGRFEKLYAVGGHDLSFYRTAEGPSGIITSDGRPPGEHTLRIVVVDFSGNPTEVTGSIVCNHPPSFDIERREHEYHIAFPPGEDITRFQIAMKGRGSGDWRVKTLFPDSLSRTRGFTLPNPAASVEAVQVTAENSLGTRTPPRFLWFNAAKGPGAALRLECDIEREFVRLTLGTGGAFTAPPSVTVYEGEARRTFAARPVAVDRYTAEFRPLTTFAGTRRIVAQGEINGRQATANREFDLYPVVAGDSGRVVLDNGNLIIGYLPGSLYTTEFLQVEKEVRGNEITYLLSPDHVVLRDGLAVSVRSPRTSDRAALFAATLGGDELLAGGSVRAGEFLAGTMTRSLGTITLTEDHTPPGVARLHIAAGRDGRPTITFRYGDDLSGVDYQEFKMYIDGQVAVPEIDGEHRRAYHHVTAPLARGSHLLLLRIKDRLGNVSEVERRFTVR